MTDNPTLIERLRRRAEAIESIGCSPSQEALTVGMLREAADKLEAERMTAEPVKATTRQVKQLLANELGLTIATVRQVISERVDLLLRSVEVEALIRNAVDHSLSSLIKAEGQGYTRDNLRNMVAEAVRTHVVNNVVFTIGKKDTP